MVRLGTKFYKNLQESEEVILTKKQDSPVVAKLFITIIKHILTQNIQRISKKHAGFSRGFSVMDHIQSINQLIEKTNEYNVKKYLCFLDFKKAFDFHYSIFLALHNIILKISISKLYFKCIEKLHFTLVERNGLTLL